MIGRTLQVLDVVADSDTQPCGLSEIARRAGVPKATTHRLLSALCAHGLVDRWGYKYVLGERLGVLAATHPADPHQSGVLRDVAIPFLLDLHRTLGGMVYLGVLADGQVHSLERLYGHHTPHLLRRLDDNRPLPGTALGRLLLADARQRAIATTRQAGSPAFAHRAAIRSDGLDADLAEIRRTGVAIDHENHLPGISCAAVPVHDRGGQVLAGIAFADYTSRFPVHQAIPNLRRSARGVDVALRKLRLYYR
ncbi:IclR family transcriptional regulator [Amycolatopsis sulphurea]|uniref:IclR family transcriptional regulator n=1 Tax=Amycolatopsis sulphurea TaxID=76022 RepID=A0A2A9FBT9_9PSEU|nr:IclR family transcriptional regulator [Amycolatopsis sulphurea]PFG47899.1 IclR family transcriptional regulator [Amycolatopsis sulphurea]